MQRSRHSYFLGIAAVLLTISWKPLWTLISLALQRDEYSHVLLIPVISGFLICWRRVEIFARAGRTSYMGLFLLVAGVGLCVTAGYFGPASVRDALPSLSLSILGLVIACAGAFLFIYGGVAFRAALFPLGFLFFIVPLPSQFLARIVYGLQLGSSESAALILKASGVPFLRDGLVFELPGFAIKVAAECSGIRSSIALLITTLVVAQFVLRSNWRKVLLCVLVVPIAVAKNGLRIATLSVLAVYVNHDFLRGRLHQSGGVVFYLVGLIALWGALRLLQSSERSSAPEQVSPIQASQPVRKAEI